MRLSYLAIALLAGGVFALGATRADEPPARLEARGPHFRVTCHGFEEEGLEEQALASVEAIWPLAVRLYGLPARRRDVPLEVHLYATQGGYEVVDQRLTGGRFARNLAFAHRATLSAHVALQPPLSSEALAEVGLPYLTEDLLAHEAAHLARYVARADARDTPGWFADGAAMWIKHRAEIDRERIADLGTNPTSATLIRRVQRLAAEGRLPSVTALLRDDTEGLHFYERYAVRWLLFRFLAEGPWQDRLPRVAAAVLGGDDGRGGAGKGAGDVEAIFDVPGLDRVDEAFRRDLEALSPTWDESFRSLDVGSRPWIQTAFPDTNAVAWRTGASGQPPWSLSGEMERVPGQGNQMNVLLDRDDDGGFLSLALHQDGHVTLFAYDAPEDAWSRLAHAPAPSLAKDGRYHAFEIQARPGRLVVSLDGREVLRSDLPDRPLAGPWGLGAQAGTAGRWRSVSFARPAPAPR